MRLRTWMLVLICSWVCACRGGSRSARVSHDAGASTGDASDAMISLRFPLERIDQLPSVPYGTPAGELVYDFGVGTGVSPGGIHIDGDGMYWTIVFTLYWGSPSGDKEPLEIARCGACGKVIDSDTTHIYWLDGSFLRRRSKRLDPEESIRLQWNHVGGDALVGERYVYAAMPGCAALTRIDKETLEQEFTYSETERGVGDTTLDIADDGSVYCGSWNRIVRVKQWGMAEVLYDGGISIEGVQITPSHVTWLDKELDSSRHSRVGRLPLAGGEVELFPLPITGHANELVYDAGSSRLIFSHGGWVTYFDLRSTRFIYVARDLVFAFNAWKGDLYWTVRDVWNEARGGEWGAIRRVPLDTPPIFVFEHN